MSSAPISIHSASGEPKPPAMVLWAGLTAGLAAILVVLLMLFIMPSLKSGPRDLAVGIVGDTAAVETVRSMIESEAPGSYDLQPMGSVEELESAIAGRTLAGGFTVQSGIVQIFVASAGSTAVSGAIAAIGEQVAEALYLDSGVTDVVALPAADPTGVGIGGLAFPLVFGGIVPVVAYRSVLAGRRSWILAGLVGFSAVGGLVVAAVLRFVFGSIEHSFWPVAGAVALGVAALALPLAGLNAWFGAKGFTVGAMAMMFLGNPFAGIATGAAWLPAGVSMIGQVLPPGAAGTLVRSAAYFGMAGGGVAALTLSCWVLVGVGLWVTAPRQQTLTTPAPDGATLALSRNQ